MVNPLLPAHHLAYLDFMHPDQIYINAFRSKNMELIETLYKKIAPKIKNLVLRNNGNETDAADLLQDAMLSIYNKAMTSDFILTCPIDAFIYIICKKNWQKNLYKKQQLRVTIIDNPEYYTLGEDSFAVAENCIREQAQKDLLSEKLQQLGEGCRKLLNLSWEGRRMEEVASILGFSYAYARKTKTECLAKLIMLVRASTLYQSLK